jgi:pimeloyl-ACP methyl ester carboxylesterase
MRIEANGIDIHVTEDGDGPAVLLLHGWPDTHELWRHQIPALTSAGYRAIAPDLRGFGDSAKPASVECYGLPELIGDAVGVLDHFGVERAHVVGHDWGAAIGWTLAATRPDRVTSLAAVSVGHPAAFASAGLEQREKSWYMLLFQFEGTAERWLSADDFRNLRGWLHHPEIEHIAARLADPLALTTGLNLYRANLRAEVLVNPPIELPPIQCPTLGVWSTGDMALTEGQMIASGDLVKTRWRYERVEGIEHWVPLEAPELLNRLLLEHLADT